MAKLPRRPRPQKRRSDLPAGEAVASRAIVSKKRDARQAGIFDAALPPFVQPQLAKLVTEAPEGERWAHELKFDGYRMHARIDRGRVQLITARSGLDWTSKYPATAEALKQFPVSRAYLDGELCAVREDGTTSFSLMQAATDGESAAGLVYYAFDLLHVDGEDLLLMPLLERKGRLAEIMKNAPGTLQYSDHIVGNGPAFLRQACKLGAEGIMSKRIDAPYRPNDRSGSWLKSKCLNREEFVVVGWTDPEGSRPYLGALLLAYYAPDCRLVYAGRAGTGMPGRELARLAARLKPLAADRMPIAVPPRTSRFGSPLVLSRVHWVRPELVVEVTYLTWTDDGLLRHVVYQGIREDKPAIDVRRDWPHARPVPPPAKPRATGGRRTSPDTHGVPRENILQLLPEAVVPSREQLESYWRKVATRALPYLANRPLKLVRHVHGITFYHRGKLPPIPQSVHQLKIEKREGGEGTRVWIDDLAGLLGLLHMDVVEVHPWGATVDNIEHPDTLVFDLDPGEGIEWSFMHETALRLRDMLEAEEGLVTWPKLTGGKGVHIMVPIERGRSWNAAHDYCRRIAERFARKDSARYTTSAKMSDRPGKLFIDYLRNGRGTTAVGTYSPRARAGFPIAAPVTWRDIERGIKPNAYTMTRLPPRK